MWNLFKETFKSISKNKIVVAGLTILVFLTSGVFTLMVDMTKSMSNQFNKYSKVSKLHDLTIDLNVHSDGSAYNDGFYVNDIDQYSPDASKYYNKALSYIENDNFYKVNYIIDPKKIESDYVSVADFNLKSDVLNSYFVKKEDFLKLYNIFQNSNDNSSINFDLKNIDSSFSVRRPYRFYLYEKHEDNTYSIKKNQLSIDLNSEIHFDKQYKLSDIANVHQLENQNIVLSQFSTLYINVFTKEATFNLIKGREWEDESKAIKIEPNKFLSKFSLESELNSYFVTNKEHLTQTFLIKEFADEVSDYKIVDNFTLKNFVSSDLNLSLDQLITFEPEVKYSIPTSWVAKSETYNLFNRLHYTTTFDKVNSNKWTGSYKEYMESLIQNSPDKKLPKEVSDFSYWFKTIITYKTYFDEQGNELGNKNKTELTVSLAKEELLHPLSYYNFENQIKPSIAEKYTLSVPRSILEIEEISNNKIDDAFATLTDSHVKEERIQAIKKGALTITKTKILDFVKAEVGLQNIGLRENITVDSVNAETNEKNVFNFVNVGDKNKKVQGVELNVGTLYNEEEYPTGINDIADSTNSFFKSNELSPYIAYKIVEYIFKNLSTNSQYIKLDIIYDKLTTINPENGEKEEYTQKKILKLADFTKGQAGLEVNKFNNLGITTYKDKYIFVTPQIGPNNGWELAVFSNTNKTSFTLEEVFEIFKAKNITVRYSYLNPNGWADVDPTFKNLNSIILGLRTPSLDIINEAIKFGTINGMFDVVQKFLLNSDLVKSGLLSKENVYNIVEAGKYGSNKNKLTTLFANGKIKANIFPLIGFDALYYLTHTSSGDYFSTLVSDVLNNLKNILLTKGTVEEQKIYLEEQFSNLLTFIKDLSGSDLSLVLPKELFANFFKDPIALLDQLSELVASVDWKSFTEKINDFISNEYNKSITKDDKTWIIKLSSTQLFTWFLESIYPNNFKSVLIKIIENIDLSFDLENTNKATIINKILWMLPQNMRKVVINLFEEINKPNPADQPFLNVVNGVKNIIKLIDLKIFTESLKNSLKLQIFTNTILEYNESQDKAVYNQVQRAAYTFNSVDILQAFLKSLFSTPGANKIFKQNLIDMFNLSDKGSVINIDDQNKIIFPSPDEDKLDIFDLISNLSLITEKRTETDANAVVVNNEFEDNYLTLLNIQAKLKKATDAYKLSQLSEKERNFLNSWFDIDPNKIYLENKEITEVQSKIQAISEFFAFFQNNSKTFKIQDKLSLGDIGQIFNVFVNSEGNSYWNALHSLLQTIIPFQPKNNFSYGEEIYPFFKIWVRLFAWNAEIDWSIKQTFALNLLSFANKKSIIDYFNSPELLRHDSHNILKYEETDFAVSRSMIDPQKMSNLFFARDSKGDYINADLRAFIALNPLFKDFIEKNQLDISATLSLVADSDHYYYYTEKELAILGSQYQYKGLYSILAFNLINTLGSWEAFKNNPSLLLKVTESIDGISGLSFIGVPEMMTNPLFISFIPQTLIWFLADINSYTTQPKNIANLAYLIMNKTINFEELANQSKEEMYEWYSYFNKTGLNPIFPLFENEDTLNIILDDEYFARLVNSDNAKEHKYNFFGVDLGKLLYTAIDTISPISYDSKFLRYNSDSAYVAKVNYAYLLKNNKSIYSGELPKDPIKLNELIERMDEKYLLNVNGIKYIIIGEDITVDYLYPVIDENNLQVNTKNQGIVYVNQEGFDRIRFAHQSNNVKNYLLVKNSTSKSSAELRDEFEEKVQDLLINSTKIRRVYLTDELDVLNPERSLRVSVVSGIINSIYNSSRLILALLVAIVAVSIIFIIRRYISNKNKVLGILLAQGYSSFEIALSLTAFATFVTVGGGILGYLVGHFSQTAAMRVLDSYWTLPTVPNVFSITSFLVTIILPLIGMSVLIILIALKSLRYKAIDLMSGINEIRIGNLRNKWHSLFKKSRVTTRFSALLLFGSFWKLISFGFSIILTSITIIFGISTFKVFDKSVDYTYQNRNYNFRYDLFTPTRQGGPLNTYNYDNLENSLYVPVGDSIEIRTAAYDYFKPGHSSILNAFPDKNGNPDDFTAHIITQFAVNVTVDSSISIDPWAITYNQMPDSQKSRINELRNKLGIALEGTQDGVYIKEDGTLDFENTTKTKGFFHFLINRNNPNLSKFVYYEYDSFTKEYAISQITTTFKRDQFREFLISAYNKLRATSDLKDFLIGFGGIYFDSSEDEKFSYATVEFKNSKDQLETINMYGYALNSEKVKLIGRNSENLLEKLNTDLIDGKYVPLVVNVVAAKKYNLTKGDILTGNVLNTVDRYTNKMNELLNIPNANNSETEFKVIGINPTYINTEFLIAKRWADKLTGLDTLNFKDGIPFNGILSSSKFPQQLLSSVSLYSPSGYWPALSNLDTSTMNLNEQQQIFDNLFGPQGLLKLQGWSDGKIVKFLNPNSSLTYEKQLEISRAEPYISIDKFSKVYDNQVLSLIANTIDSKDIQVGFAKTISSTVQTIVTSIIILSFIITIVILIILSTIIIGENEKNIAIWTILGYSQKEKLIMFFSIFIPFILISILFAIPIAYGIISFFSWILIAISGLAIPISITVWNVFVTLSVVMVIFLATSLLVWRYINKIKAIDLLKGK